MIWTSSLQGKMKVDGIFARCDFLGFIEIALLVSLHAHLNQSNRRFFLSCLLMGRLGHRWNGRMPFFIYSLSSFTPQKRRLANATSESHHHTVPNDLTFYSELEFSIHSFVLQTCTIAQLFFFFYAHFWTCCSMCRKLSLLVWPGNPLSVHAWYSMRHSMEATKEKRKKGRVGHVVATRYCYALMGRTRKKKGVRFCQNSYPRSMDRNTLFCFYSGTVYQAPSTQRNMPEQNREERDFRQPWICTAAPETPKGRGTGSKGVASMVQTVTVPPWSGLRHA